MPCYFPNKAYVLKGKTESGKKQIVFTKPTSYMETIDLPCGQCIGCKLLRSSIWALRCMHESQQHEDNCFITLTYDDNHLPQNQSLYKPHFQDFIKRLRKSISPNKLRYYMCGEYGDETWRPHYHALIFGYDFHDKQPVNEKQTENQYYLSPSLSNIWGKGNHIITDLTYETAAYVARYCTKKITGEKAEAHYNRIIHDFNEITGELHHYEEVDLEPEYGTMSKGRKPATRGIGYDWFQKYKTDCYPSDYLIHEGRKIPVPDYYDKLYEEMDKRVHQLQKNARKIKAISRDKIPLERLHTIADLRKSQINKRNKI